MNQASVSSLLVPVLPARSRRPSELTAAAVPLVSAMIQADLPLFQDIGLAQLTPEQIIHLKSRYLPFQDQACVGEILRWLAGEYVFDPDCLTD